MSDIKTKMYEIIFEADTPRGKFFDVILLILIVLSLMVVMLETVSELRESLGGTLRGLEWVLTALFTMEYLLRLYCAPNPLKYALSFFGLVDLFAIIPSYLGFFIDGSQSLLVIRSLRLLRVFRVLKLGHFLGEAGMLLAVLRASRIKISIFIFTVVQLVIIVGSLMYLIEGPENGFTSIPQGVYWAIVTMTTVGYGDMVPHTVAGKILSSFLMILGYGIIAVPTGIMSAEMIRVQQRVEARTCPQCLKEGHRSQADYCWSCGGKLV